MESLLILTSISGDASKDDPREADGPGEPSQAGVGRVDARVEANLAAEAREVDLPVILEAEHGGQAEGDAQQPAGGHDKLVRNKKYFRCDVRNVCSSVFSTHLKPKSN